MSIPAARLCPAKAKTMRVALEGAGVALADVNESGVAHVGGATHAHGGRPHRLVCES